MDTSEATPRKRLCIYCGSRDGHSKSFAAAAEELGLQLGRSNIDLIYGAGSIGLMGRVARSAMAAGSHVVGVIPKHLHDIELTQDGLAEAIVTENMHQRKMIMFQRADAFLILPGGFGTMDEMFEVITWCQLGLHQKPIMILNLRGFWDPLLNFMRYLSDSGFTGPSHAEILRPHNDIESIIQAVQAAPFSAEMPDKSDLF